MIYKNIFQLNAEEIKMIDVAKNRSLSTKWCRSGKIQEKGAEAEQTIAGLLTLCEDITVAKSNFSSELDEILKVDMVVAKLTEPKDVFAFQIKSSLTGAKLHYEKYPEIFYEGKRFRTPWCFIIDASSSNIELLDLLIDELLLDFDLDMELLEEIVKDIFNSNSKSLSKKAIFNKFRKLTNKEQKALRLLFNIGRNSHTFFIR